MQFEIWKSVQNGQWYWRLKSLTNNHTIANGEGYHNRADCEHAVGLVKQWAASAPIKYL